MDFAVVPANYTVEAKVERLGLVELKQCRHQLDKTRFHLLSLRWQGENF